jgi:3-isopropylmalate/(R)-2-methylmalate dehydratase small subunit
MAVETIRHVKGAALPLRGDNIDTDRIIPARFLKSITFEGLETHLFEDDRQQANAESRIHPLSNFAYAGASILIVNTNFGCGSSREHAPQAIRRLGIRAVVGQSFSEIFFGNSVAMGMPCLTAPAETVERLMASAEATPAIEMTIDLESLVVLVDGATHTVTLPPGARESFLNGTWDATGLLLDRFEQVEAVARRLPYVAGW